MDDSSSSSSSSSSFSPPCPATSPSTSSSRNEGVSECMYRTKLIQFFGRTTRIVLQNKNGPCPLLAICNVLLLGNNINMDGSEVSEEQLLSLVVEQLIDSNSEDNEKDAEYVENQQQNIADAIDLLPRFASGINVNIRFRRIDDFEFTPECAVFDLLDIPLYHGWMVDPQDIDTTNAIDSKSYNTLMEDLVALETKTMECKLNSYPAETYVDFASASLWVSSHALSKTQYFEESPHPVPKSGVGSEGDLEEVAELLRASKLSKIVSSDESQSSVNNVQVPVGSGIDGQTCKTQNQYVDQPETLLSGSKGDLEEETKLVLKVSETTNSDESQSSVNNVHAGSETLDGQTWSTKSQNVHQQENFSSAEEVSSMAIGKGSALVLKVETATSTDKFSTASVGENQFDVSRGDDNFDNLSTSTADVLESSERDRESHTAEVSVSMSNDTDASGESGTTFYEGEDCILDSVTSVCRDRETLYEGEAVLAEQSGCSGVADSCKAMAKGELSREQGKLIRNFLTNTATQLTFYGLLCLQEGIDDRELCVFFRNNHFSTMFKYEGELYLLATDEGYLNQPSLVWEKLNEVNGDTLFTSGDFKEFKLGSQENDAWDQHNARTTTADYLARPDAACQARLNMNIDLQLKMVRQQQEVESQAQQGTQSQKTQPHQDMQPQRQNKHPPSSSGPQSPCR